MFLNKIVDTGIEPVKHKAVVLKTTPVSNWVIYLVTAGIEPAKHKAVVLKTTPVSNWVTYLDTAGIKPTKSSNMTTATVSSHSLFQLDKYLMFAIS